MTQLIHCWTVFGIVTGFFAVSVPTHAAQDADAATATTGTAYSVGVAVSDITPAYPIRLNGFGGRSKESEGVRQHLWAKALAVGTNDRDTVVVITVDTLGIPDDLTERVAKKLQAHGLDRSRLAVCASHTHSGPMIQNCAITLFGQPIPDAHWETILKYSAELETQLEQVAIAALADRRPSRLSWGIGKLSFAQNRRTAGGPVDHDLPLLAVHDPDGRLRAVFANYACHCVTLSDDWISGDWAGYAMDHIQRRNPACAALISIGCGADSNPRGGVPLAGGMVATAKADSQLPTEPAEIAAWLLDDQHPAADRERLLAETLDKAGDVIPLMAAGLPPEPGSKEEYRRIPWIWRVARAVGKGGDETQIRSVLAASLPKENQRLEHWQSVVIGGGLINGIGLVGEWPDKQLSAIIGKDAQLLAGWKRSLELSVKMADDESVPTGTRYDALRMVAMIPTLEARQQLERYLVKGTNPELQMGAVSGLSDLDEDGIAALMIDASAYLPEVNLKLALRALTRDERRAMELLDAIQQSKLPHVARQQLDTSALLQHSSERVRTRAGEVLK